ncbi:MAG: phage tail tape measure protein, partial [Actinobacteria bacterium]|nr:phage tail tape measure protein [Actinomycetota bacterium]
MPAAEISVLIRAHDEASAALREATRRIKELENAADGAAGKTKTFGATLNQGVGQALAFGLGMLGVNTAVQAVRGAFEATVGEAIRYESAMTQVAKTTDASEEQVSRWADAFQDMSERIPVGAEQLAHLARVAGSLGVSNANMVQFVETAARLGASVDDLAPEAAIEGLARFSAITGTAEGDVGRLASTLVGLGNEFAATEGDILEMSLRLAGAGEAAGLTEGDIFGLAAAMRSVGIESEAGGTAMSKILIEIKSRAATGGQALAEFAAVAGTTSDEFKRMAKEAPIDALMAFIAGLERSNTAGGELFLVLDKLGLNETRLQRALLSAVGARDQVNRAVVRGNELYEENTALVAESSRQFETTASKIEMTKNQLGNMAADIGAMILPTIKDLLGEVKNAGSFFEGLGTAISGVQRPTRNTTQELRDQARQMFEWGEEARKHWNSISGITSALYRLIGSKLMDKAAE